MAAARVPIHPGDAALLTRAVELAGPGHADPDDWRVLDDTLADADWRAYGTPGCALLLGRVAGQSGRGTWDGAVSRRLQALYRALGLGDGLARGQALGDGLGVALPWFGWMREMRAGWSDQGEGLLREALRGSPDAEARVAFERALGRLRRGEDRLALARAFLGNLDQMFAKPGEAEWRPAPASVAWLTSGFMSPCDPDTAWRIIEAEGQTLHESLRPAGAVRGECASEWLFAVFAAAAMTWNDRQVATYRRQILAAVDLTEALYHEVRMQRVARAPAVELGLDPEAVARGMALIERRLGIAQAAKALRGGEGVERRRSRRRA